MNASAERYPVMATHKITLVTLIPPDGIDWACQCGTTGRCPRPIAAYILAAHLTETKVDLSEY
jgi:hypothetical protein